MAIRIKARGTPGAIQLADNVLSELIGVADIRKSVQRGDDNLGTLTGCVDSTGTLNSTGIIYLLVGVPTYASNGILKDADEYHANGIFDTSNWLAAGVFDGTDMYTSGMWVDGAYHATGWWDGAIYVASPDFPDVGNVRPPDTTNSVEGTLANLVATDAAYLALEGPRNSTTAAAGDIVTGHSVTIAGVTTNGSHTCAGGYTYGDNDPSFVLTTAEGAGTYQPVAAADVRIGTAVGVSPAVGTCWIPGADQVIFGQNVDDTTGTFKGIVDSAGLQYDDGGTLTTLGVYHEAGIIQVHPITGAKEHFASGVFDATTRYATTGLVVTEVKDTVTWKDGDGEHTGTWDAVTKTDVVAATWVVVGHDRWTGGAAGEYPTTATSQAAQLAADQATVLASAEWIVSGHSILGQAGTFDEATRNTDPGIANVVDGVTYKILNVSLVGEYVGGSGYTYGDNDPTKVLTTATGAGTYVAIGVNNALHTGSSYFGAGGALDGNYYGPSSQAGVTTTTTYGVGNATSGTLNMTLYCLIAGITWPALDEVDGGVHFGHTTGIEYEGTGVNATTVAAAILATPANKLVTDASGAVTPTAASKTGYALSATGLDSIPITSPTGPATTFREAVVQTWRRFFKKATKTSTQLKTYADNGTTVVTTQTVSDDATTETQGEAS